MKLTLRLLAPYMAVGVFWCGLSNAWLAILAYHAQILFWSYGPYRSAAVGTLTRSAPSSRKRALAWALPAALAGPLLYLLLPHITHTDISVWLSDHRLTGPALVLMIPYFGVLHPLLEQLHWSRLREQSPIAHPAFAAYHVLVLHTLLTVPWLIFCFAILTTASVIWRLVTKRSGHLAFAIASHVLADLGIVVAAWLTK